MLHSSFKPPRANALLTTTLGMLLFASPMLSVAKASGIETQPLIELGFYPEFSAPAEVISRNNSLLSSEITARIEQVWVDVGDSVKQGDALVELECSDYQISLEAQEALERELDARLTLANDQYRRAVDLNRAGNLGDELLEQRATELRVVRAQKESQAQQILMAKRSVDRCTVRAPFAGVVTERMAQLGALATPGMGLVRLVELDQPSIRVYLEPDIDLNEQDTLQFRYRSMSYPAIVSRYLPIVDSRTRTREVRLSFAEQAAPIGSVGRLVWTSALLHLPANLLSRRRVESEWLLGVLWRDEGITRFEPVPNAIEGQPFYVDLPARTEIVTSGRLGLNPDSDTAPETESQR